MPSTQNSQYGKAAYFGVAKVGIPSTVKVGMERIKIFEGYLRGKIGWVRGHIRCGY